MPHDIEQVRASIRDIPDFPKPGIVFKDITPALRNPESLRSTVKHLSQPFKDQGVTAVAGMEARGFILGSLVALELNVGFVPLRKPGKLPYHSKSISYDLEYGSASLEIHTDAVGKNDRVVIIDDLLATGGTAEASCKLIELLGAEVVACGFMVELDFLNGRDRLKSRTIHSLIHF
jgi:adenine phosphoribosyltransferase